MNRRELQSDRPIHVPLLHVLSFPPSDEHCRHSRAARATPSNHTRTQRYASCNCSELRCYLNTLRRFVSPEPSTKPFKRRPEAQIASIRYGLFGRAHCVGWHDAAVAVRAGVAELATFVRSSSSDMTCCLAYLTTQRNDTGIVTAWCSDYASVIALRCQVS